MPFNFNWYDIRAFGIAEKQAAQIQQIYNAAISEVAKLVAALGLGAQDNFSFNKYPRLKKKVDELFKNMAQQTSFVINKGSADAWALSNAKNDKFLEFLAEKTGHKKSYLKNKYNYGVRNQEALKSFQNRKRDGLGLSDRVWKYTTQHKTEIESAIDVALSEGSSAASLSRQVREYLNNPDTLFRRIRNKHGSLVPSRAMKAFRPGQGVYKSAAKNAMRLARTEINMGYREADHQRWQQMDFVQGIQIKLSNSPNHCPTCQRLAGKYPKGFKWSGWHVQCRCFAVPILQSQDDFIKSLTDDNFKPTGQIDEMPANFKDWHKDNSDKISRAKNLPYFLRDNKDVIKGLQVNTAINTVEKVSKLDDVLSKLKTSNIDYNDAKLFKETPAEADIIDRIGGGDKTKGSCSSLAFAYAGNKSGFDVLDFRDGSSRQLFSQTGTITDIAERVGGKVVKNTNDFTKASELIRTVEIGKEYYFTCGSHSSIVRKTTKGFEYLELQSATNNGFKPLTSEVLKRRFGAKKSHTIYKQKVETKDCIIDIDLLKEDPLFRELLGYLNTNVSQQKKGLSGTIK